MRMVKIVLGLLLVAPVGGFSSSAQTALRGIDRDIAAKVEAITDTLISIRRDFHVHPELSNREFRTSKVVADRLRSLGLEVSTGIAHTGVVGLLRGKKDGPWVAVRADMDALPIQETIDKPYRSLNDGVKHACGHDVHMTVGLGTARVLTELKSKLKGNVKFIFQPAEEGAPQGEEGGAALMVKEGVLKDPDVSAIFGLHVMPFIPVGQVGFNEGPTMAAAARFEIEITGKMSHGAYPQLGVDAVVVAAYLVTAFQTITSRQIDTREPVVLSVGIIESGNRFNIIADKARLVGTVRTLKPGMQDEVRERMHRIAAGVTEAFGASYKMDYKVPAPVTANDVALTRASVPVLRRIVGADNVLEPKPQMGAEDFAYFAREIPGFYFFLGVSNEQKGITADLHTPDFDVDETAIPLGVRLMSALVIHYLEESG